MGEFFEMQQEGLLDWTGEYVGPLPNSFIKKNKSHKKIKKATCLECGKVLKSMKYAKQHYIDAHFNWSGRVKEVIQ